MTRNSGKERHVAALTAVAINAWAVWALSTAMQPHASLAVEPVALEVVWIERPATVFSAPATPTAPSERSTLRRRATHTPPPKERAATVPAEATTTSEPPAARPMSAVYLAHARQWARAETGSIDTTQDPLADRLTQLPGKAAERFRMRPPMTPERAVAMVGRLFGGNDPKEPCRSNRARIAALGTDSDSAALQRELDFERRWCRP